MKRRRSFALLFLLLTLCGCAGEQRSSGLPQTGSELVCGYVMPLTGSLCAGWESAAGDSAAAALLAGYGTTVLSESGARRLSGTAVEGCQILENADGSRSYLFTLKEGLVYNTGEPITAQDYVFSLLYRASPAAAAIGAQYEDGSALDGYWLYRSGESERFSGVRLLDAHSFMLTIAAQSLPCRDEAELVEVQPLPRNVIAPEAEVLDDGDGAYLSAALTKELLTQTMLDRETGYRWAPAVTCGPYQFSACGDGWCSLTLNAHYAPGDTDAAPTIPKLTFRSVGGDGLKKLAAGEIDLLCGVTGAQGIESGLTLVSNGGYAAASYPRNGFGRLLVRCDGAAALSAVRQALACCLDRDTLARRYTGGYGAPVNGFYGLGSPEYAALELELANALDDYAYDPERARALLTESGIALPLTLKLATTGNAVSQLVGELLLPAAQSIGLHIEETVMDFEALSASAAAQKPEYDLYCTALDLPALPKYWLLFSADGGLMDAHNANRIAEPALSAAALALKAADVNDREAWLSAWFGFQKAYNALLPDIPLYSDLCYDFFSDRLTDYTPDALRGFPYAILRAHLR